METSSTPRNSKEAQKEKIRKRFSKAAPNDLIVIPARQQPHFMQDTSGKNVAVYARVSTLAVQQTSSYEMQQTYYSEMVESREGWNLHKIYADEGISGTSLKHRDAFNQMIADCKTGDIDMIITKSVSRFARNVNDCITYIQELAAHKPPIGIYFENEGLYTLDSEKELILTFSAAMAQEESHIKSNSMNASIEMRFSHGWFITPPLLGYDKDEDGNLVINEEEAKTVTLIFFMYLYGYSPEKIAETLTALGRKTKTGNTKWASGSITGVLKNEKHCGDVRARKSFTPNYLNHKSVKNCGERNQYYQENHHNAIINRDDFNAVQKMLANAKYGGRSFMPELNVISGGVLNRYVMVNPRWAAFTVEDYRVASERAGYNGPNVENQISFVARRGDIDLRGYEIVRTQFFSSSEIQSVTFSKCGIRFSAKCIRKLSGAEYVEILVHPMKKMLAVRPCEKENKHASHWAAISDGILCPRSISGAAFIDTLYGLFGWLPENKYRFRGVLLHRRDESCVCFDLNEPEIMTSDGGLFRYEWYQGFGSDYYSRVKTTHILDDNTAHTGEQTTYNTEPDIHPIERGAIAGNINKLISEILNSETDYGTESDTES